jgi:hypothetical protein
MALGDGDVWRGAQCPRQDFRDPVSQAGPWTVTDNSWIVEEVIAMFGAQRAMSASNFPVDGLCGTFDAVWSGFKRIASRYSVEDQRLLFRDTARNVYRIGLLRQEERRFRNYSPICGGMTWLYTL